MVEPVEILGSQAGFIPPLTPAASIPVSPLRTSSAPKFSFSDCSATPIKVTRDGPRPVRPGSFYNRKTGEVRFAVEIDPEMVEQVNLLLFSSPDDHEPSKAIKLPNVTRGTVGAMVKGSGIGPGTIYAYEVISRTHPERARWAFDPYSLAVIRQQWLSIPDRHIEPTRYHIIPPKSVVLDLKPFRNLPLEERPRPAFRRIYELNVRDTKNFPDSMIPDNQAGFRGKQGTFAFLGCPAFIEHVKRFGTTTIELMPVQLSDDELGVENVWGYNVVSFFALDNRLCHATDPVGQVEEFREAVLRLRREGLEVIIDFVGGHTHELGKDQPSRPYYGGHIKGPSTSLRVLGERLYYLMAPDLAYFDLTGCQNTINIRSPQSEELVARAFAHWMGTMGVDGLRIDQATILGLRHKGDPREPHFEFEPDTLPYRMAEALKNRITVIEPGAPGMWATGRFPEKFIEWLFAHRADEGSLVTHFLSGCAYSSLIGSVAAQVAGNSDVYHAGPNRGINFTSCHDGYRTADVCRKAHQALVGRGILKWTGDEERERQIAALGRAHVAWSAFTSGVWMITAGEEFFRSYAGHGNAFNKKELLGLPWGTGGAPAEFCKFLEGAARVRTALKYFDRAELFCDCELQWYRQDGVEIGLDARKYTNGDALKHKLGEEWGREGHFLGALYSNGNRKPQPDKAPVYVVRWGGGEGSFKLPAAHEGTLWRLCVDSWAGTVCRDGLATLNLAPVQCRDSQLFEPGAEYKLSGPSVIALQLISVCRPDNIIE